jgi:hypothetical protein
MARGEGAWGRRRLGRGVGDGGGGSPDDIVSSLQGVRALLTHPMQSSLPIFASCKLDLLPGLLPQFAQTSGSGGGGGEGSGREEQLKVGKFTSSCQLSQC